MEASFKQRQQVRRNDSFASGRGFRLLLAAGVLGIAAITVSQQNSHEMTQLFTASGATDSTKKALSFALGNSIQTIEQNDITRAKNIAVGYPWEYIVEPYRETTFLARDNFCTECTDDQYEWTIGDKHLVGRQVSFMAERVGTHEILLSVTDSNGVIIQRTDSIMAKYVRREIRSLSDSERQLVFDSMHAIYSNSIHEGKAKGFGAKFLDIAHFVAKHIDGSASLACDSWHDCAAFYTTHVAFTLEFEQSMQAVAPQVTLPYWDFTKDAYDQSENGVDWKSSHLFSDKWFGSVSSHNHQHAIDSGIFAYTPVKKVGFSSSVKHNAYGLLRSPWNVNNSPYVTRSALVEGYKAFQGNLPSCQDYMECFLSAEMAVMNECLNGKTHGAAHVEIGGIWGKNIENSLIQEDNAYNLLLMTKNLWRQGWVRCPDKCIDGEECSCWFNEAAMGDMSAYQILVKSGLLSWVVQTSHMVYLADDGNYRINGLEGTDKENKAWETMLKTTLATTGNVGEMFSSASPYDPTFWIIHGTVDRLVHWRRLISESNYVDLPLGEVWGYAHNTKAASDPHLVCDWSHVDSTDPSSMPMCMDGNCPGTDKDDMTPFTGFVSDSDTYSNSDMYKFLSPLNDDLPYVYDNFEWSHCDDLGYTFGVQQDGTVLSEFALPIKKKTTTSSGKATASAAPDVAEAPPDDVIPPQEVVPPRDDTDSPDEVVPPRYMV